MMCSLAFATGRTHSGGGCVTSSLAWRVAPLWRVARGTLQLTHARRRRYKQASIARVLGSFPARSFPPLADAFMVAGQKNRRKPVVPATAAAVGTQALQQVVRAAERVIDRTEGFRPAPPAAVARSPAHHQSRRFPAGEHVVADADPRTHAAAEILHDASINAS